MWAYKLHGQVRRASGAKSQWQSACTSCKSSEWAREYHCRVMVCHLQLLRHRLMWEEKSCPRNRFICDMVSFWWGFMQLSSIEISEVSQVIHDPVLNRKVTSTCYATVSTCSLLILSITKEKQSWLNKSLVLCYKFSINWCFSSKLCCVRGFFLTVISAVTSTKTKAMWF